jgi:tetratricopeptide (TPR) repeat protein
MPKPYGKRFVSLFLGFTLLALASALADSASEKTGKKQAKKAQKAIAVSASTPGRNLAILDPDTQAGLEWLYSLEYDKAIASFESALKQYPSDPFAINHLMQAVMLKELFRLNALDTTLYTDNGFLTGKPLPGEPKIKERIFALADQAIKICDQRIDANRDDVQAYYARGVSRGLRLSYIALVDKSFWSALKNAISSRNDHEKVLELDPSYTDARLVVGVHNFIVGSMPLAARIMAGVVGIRGDKKKGIEYLEQVGKTRSEVSADARVALALFLRREARYKEALDVMQGLATEHPKNFIFALEVGNLMKDAGRADAAVAQFDTIVKNAQRNFYPSMHIERAYFGLAEALKGQRKAEAALEAYNHALEVKEASHDLRLRAFLGAGQMLDVLSKRESALKHYEQVLTLEPDSAQAALARSYIKQPYRYPS